MDVISDKQASIQRHSRTVTFKQLPTIATGEATLGTMTTLKKVTASVEATHIRVHCFMRVADGQASIAVDY